MAEIQHGMTRDQIGLAYCRCGWRPDLMTFVEDGPKRVQEHITFWCGRDVTTSTKAAPHD